MPPADWQKLQDGYNAILESVPGGILRSSIIQERSDPTLWRLVTVWENFEQLKAMQQSNAIPPGVKIFKDIGGVEPKVKIFNVRSSFGKP